MPSISPTDDDHDLLLHSFRRIFAKSHVHAMSLYHRQWTDPSAHNSLLYVYRQFPRQLACTHVRNYGIVHIYCTNGMSLV